MLHYEAILSSLGMIAMLSRLFGKSSDIPMGASQMAAVPGSAAPMPAAPMLDEQKSRVVIMVTDNEQAKEAKKYYSYFETEKFLQIQKKRYVTALYCIMQLCTELFADHERSYNGLVEIGKNVENAREMLDGVKAKLDALEQAEEKLSEQESPVPLNRELRLIATQDWARLKAHMAERETKGINTDSLPTTDFGKIPAYLVAGIHVALAHKPKNNPEAEECFQIAVEEHNSRFEKMREAVNKRRKLLVDLPQQKDDYESCRARLYSIQAKINKRLEARAAKDLAAQGKFAARGPAIVEAQPASLLPPRHESRSGGPS